MAFVLAVTNQKGGVGKTTSVVNLAAFTALGGLRTLVVDCDPQGNATSVLCPVQDGAGIFSGGTPIACQQESLFIFPASDDLRTAPRRSGDREPEALLLRNALSQYRQDFDLVFLDCPPSLTAFSVNALLAADGILVPIQCEYFAMEGLTQLMRFLDELLEQHGASPPISGVLLTMSDERTALARDVITEIRYHLGDKVFKTAIPRDIALAAAPSHSQTILEYDPMSSGGISYLLAAKELIRGLR